MKNISIFLNESLAINESKTFDFNKFDKQVMVVDKVFKNKSKLNQWAIDELGGKVEGYIYDDIDTIMDYLRGWEDNCQEGFDDEDWEDQYKNYKDQEYVQARWNGIWACLADDFGPDTEAVVTVFEELWITFAGESFPFELDY